MASRNSRTGSAGGKKGIPTFFILALMYAAGVVIRYGLALYTHVYTTVIIDEHLYYSIARSIANGEGLLFMGQPADYSSILYPLIISPVYLLPEGTNYFQMIQLWNILLMHLSIIPLYALARDIIGDRKTALAAAAVSLLAPDMMLGGYVMSEAILFPLICTMMYVAYQYFVHKKVWQLAVAGVIGGLIYCTKPGQVIPAAVILIVAVIAGVKARDRKQLLAAGLGLAGLAAVIGCGYGVVYLLFRHPVSLLGVYDDQLFGNQTIHWWEFIRAILLSPYCFYLMTSGLCLVLPIHDAQKLAEAKRNLLWILLISTAVIMLGTAWAVNQVEYIYSTIHTRYFSVYVPLLMILSMDLAEKGDSRKLKRAETAANPYVVWGITVYFVVCLFLFGITSGVDMSTNIMSNIALSLLRGIAAKGTGILWSIVFAAGAAALACYVTLSKKPFLRPLIAGIMALNFIVNACYAYSHAYEMIDKSFVNQADVIRETIAGRDFVYIYGTNRLEYNAYLDPNTQKSVCMIYINDLYNNTMQSDGIYEPFLPAVQRGTIPQNLTTDTDLFVVDKGALSHLMLSDSVQWETQDRSLNMQVLKIPQGERWVDAFLGGPVNGKLESNTTGFISLYKDEYRQNKVIISLKMEIVSDTQLVGRFGDQAYSFDLPAGTDTYSIRLNQPTDTMTFVAKDSELRIVSFDVQVQ